MTARSIVQVLYGGLGGAENMALTLAKALQVGGAEASVLCLQAGPFVDRVRDLGIPVDVVPVRSPLDVVAFAKLCRYFRQRRFDVVHTHLRRAMLVGNPAARFAGTPAIVTTVHGRSDLDGTRFRDRAFARGEGVLGRFCADQCVTYTESLRQESIRGRGLAPDRVSVIHHGINLDVFHAQPPASRRAAMREQWGAAADDFVIGAVGRLISAKGHRHLIAAMPQIVHAQPRARLILVGVGSLRDELEAIAVRGGVRERIVFAGDITADRDVYAAMDVFVYPSIQGVFGIVVLEAMACGIPVVVSRLEGTDELIQHEHNGLLVGAADASGIADAVWRVGRDATLRQRLIQHGHDTMLRVGSDTEMARRYRAVYDAVLSR